MTCDNCGAPATGTRCADCRRYRALEARERSISWGECPECGGITSGEGVVCADCRRDGDDPVPDGGGVVVDAPYFTPGWVERVFEHAHDNVQEWGTQDVETLLLAMQEELGELTQAHLEYNWEGGDEHRVPGELLDLAALVVQLHWRVSGAAVEGTDAATDGGTPPLVGRDGPAARVVHGPDPVHWEAGDDGE